MVNKENKENLLFTFFFYWFGRTRSFAYVPV